MINLNASAACEETEEARGISRGFVMSYLPCVSSTRHFWNRWPLSFWALM